MKGIGGFGVDFFISNEHFIVSQNLKKPVSTHFDLLSTEIDYAKQNATFWFLFFAIHIVDFELDKAYLLPPVFVLHFVYDACKTCHES
ncbi:MAG: hypothetical protein H6Q14_2694 [Bacteroidetes bacterium]|nr:hypothetical protein [Bacteroidota bacterium]